MVKKIIQLLIIAIYFSLALYLIYCYNSLNYNIDTKYTINSKSNYYHKKMIEIPSIDLKLHLEKADDDFGNLDSFLVYYKSFNTDNKIIIFGHSGMGKGTFFNRLDELKTNDLIYLYNDNKKYKYFVNKIYTVDKKRIDILNEEIDAKKLLLITCNKNNKNNRLVIELLQKDWKIIEK